jgi:WD40 repeat protein
LAAFHTYSVQITFRSDPKMRTRWLDATDHDESVLGCWREGNAMRVLKGHTGKLRAVVYSPDGSKLATAGDAGVTKLWDVATGRELATIRQPDAAEVTSADEKRVSQLTFSHDGKLLVTGTGGGWVKSGRIRLWEVPSAKPEGVVETARELPFPDELRESSPPMEFTPDDAFLILAQGRGIYGQPRRFASTILAWNRKTGQIEGPFVETQDEVTALVVSARADLLAVASSPTSRSYVRLWSLTSKQEQGKLDLPAIPQSHLRPAIQGLAVSPDGQSLAVAAGTQVFIFDLPQRRLRGKIDVHANQVASVAFAPSNRLLATASQDGSVRLWDTEALSERAAYDWEIGKLRHVAFHPDSLTIAVVGEKSGIVIWDVEGS